MLETEQLVRTFKGKTAVDEVTLYLEKGESVGLLGPNGAGKSTTISMISSLMKPTSGDVRIHGISTISEPQKIRKVLGVVPQEIALYEELTAEENVRFFGKVYGLKGEALKQKTAEVLALVGLTERKDERVDTYSGGMKRRVNIAAALLHEPELLIMDEPTVGIDPQSRSYILEMIRTLNREKGMTVLYTSHYMEEVERLCDRIYIMDNGRIIASGTKEELKQILSDEETIVVETAGEAAAFFEEAGRHEKVRQVVLTENGAKLMTAKGARLLGWLFQEAESRGVTVTNVNVQTPTLEDVFLHLTGRRLRD
ncbi:ABC transporter ATP-binding protein [Alkalicoccus urumqiensis]|uniref:Export ABC transporter ATP-binding protein n=1 Tax=Alkalicoccus urumqiensis TaxID=1548213 RepID=A0A2P6MJT8_ALKUR|nr:ABC transporter ATP-binding protein [Alkalicoccus urumqiensis]PRO66556.1 export ABC transporter ATP-binding protein [Alkalicoccus urumqiensis]